MLQYSIEQLATVIAVPIVTILLVWTIAIFHKNRKKWGPYDIPVVTILTLSVLRNLTVLSYTLIIVLNQSLINLEYCSVVVWIFNSVHTFQASSLTTLAVIGMFAAKLYRKQQNLRQFLTSTHVIYHLFCLTTLCACVGVAAILAQHESARDYTLSSEFAAYGIFQNPCKFMPFQLDLKFNVFIIVLHIFLAIVSVTSFIMICYHHYKAKVGSFDYLKKSSSDLSELSLGMSATYASAQKDHKAYYDTYTIHRGAGDHGYYEGNGCYGRDGVWNSDVSNISTTVSSTNSRRPCLAKKVVKEEEVEENRTGLETIHPVLIVCYLFYHLPLIGLCIFPRIIAPWPVSGAALWLGLLQDILIPTGLGLVDTRFCGWVSRVYRCTDRERQSDKLPQVGVSGKFRPFGSQPQSLEVPQAVQERTCRTYQPTEHKFPITNGSLYTSIDGRVPVIHNYRRPNREQRGYRTEAHSLNMGIHATHIRRQNSRDNFLNSYQKHPQNFCGSCEPPNRSNILPRNTSVNFSKQTPGILVNNRRFLEKKSSLSQSSLNNQTFVKSDASIPMLRRNVLRLSKSEDSLSNVHSDLRNFKQDPEAFQKKKQNRGAANAQLLDYSSSEEEESFTDSINVNDTTQNFDTLSSESCCSITTDGNCDFEFYQNSSSYNLNSVSSGNLASLDLSEKSNNVVSMRVTNQESEDGARKGRMSRASSQRSLLDDIGPNFRITRSNSKRSLENFRAYVSENSFVSEVKVQRSNSFVRLEDKMNDLARSNSRLSDGKSKMKFKSAEALNLGYNNVVCIEDSVDFCVVDGRVGTRYGGSVPDFKKIFISEYI